MELFERHLSHIIGGTLGKRSVSIGYDYSEIIRSLMCVYFCGDSCSEEIVKTVAWHSKLYYIRINRCQSIYNDIFALRGWKCVEINGIEYELDSILVEKWKGTACRTLKVCQQKGSRIAWQEVMRIAGTQIVVRTIAKRIDGNQVEVRQCTEPEKQLSDLYKKLDLTSPPLKRRRKICVVHFSELKKTILENQRVIRI